MKLNYKPVSILSNHLGCTRNVCLVLWRITLMIFYQNDNVVLKKALGHDIVY